MRAAAARFRLSQVARENGWIASRAEPGVRSITWTRGRQWLYVDFDRLGRVTCALDSAGKYTGTDRAAQIAAVLIEPAAPQEDRP